MRHKLQVAKLAAQNNPAFAVNVQALETVQPKDLEASEIAVRLGATWLAPELIKQFADELVDAPYYVRDRVKVLYIPLTGVWNNLIIYGHNMKDGSMFADLVKYRSKDFWQAHKTVRFDTALGGSAYEIFAVIHTTVQADAADAFPFYRFVDAAAPEDFADYVSACQVRALYDTGMSAQYGDKLLTLSTCDNITDNGRLLVIAKRILY